MTGFILFLIVITIVAALIWNDKKKSKTTIRSTSIPAKYSNSSNRKQVNAGNYFPTIIQSTGLQILETVHILGTSKSLDTIAGRYDFLLSKIDVLKKGSLNARYPSDIQKSIDKYKSVFYDRIPNDYELALILKPKDFDIVGFYCKSLSNAFKTNYEEHLEEIKILKREDAKIRRKEKIKELLTFTKNELSKKCSSSPYYLETINELEKFETTLQSETSNNVLGPNDYSRNVPNTEVDSTIISIKTKNTETNRGRELVLNPGAPFELTLLDAEEKIGLQVKSILEGEDIYDYKKRSKIVALFSEYNLKVKEIEEYRKKYGKVYKDKLNELKNSSAEWQSLGTKDKEDLLQDFREVAVKTIYEKANCDLVTLFEKEPSDITVDDDLIKEYGFENVETYLRFADNLEKVRVIQNDNYNRTRFEKLVEMDLAIRGTTIPIEEILSTLSLKELNTIANNSEKEYKRKNQAIEYILALPNIEEQLSNKISFRELFKLKPLPEKYFNVNLKEISNAWSYTSEIVKLLVDTYINARSSAETLKDKQYVKGYKVNCWSDEENMCPCAKDLMSKSYTKGRPPKIPYHVGCNCSLEKEYNFD